VRHDLRTDVYKVRNDLRTKGCIETIDEDKLFGHSMTTILKHFNSILFSRC